MNAREHRESNDAAMWDAYHRTSIRTAVGALNALKTHVVCRLFAMRIAGLAGRFDSVLELGVGTASTLDVLARRSGARAVGIDRSEPAVALARARYPHLDVRVGDMFDLDLEPRSFDLVYSVGLLEHFTVDDQRRLLSIHAKYARRCVVLMTPGDSLLMNAILFVNRRVLGRSGVWADEDVFSERILRQRFPGTPFEVRWDRHFGNLIVWFGFHPDRLNVGP
jgi:SAM-dependent methyltransferase